MVRSEFSKDHTGCCELRCGLGGTREEAGVHILTHVSVCVYFCNLDSSKWEFLVMR